MSRLPAPGSVTSQVLLALVCAVVLVDAMRPVGNPDLGWHLAMGRWIAEHGAVPSAEPFTHTARGAPMVAHQWLAQLLYHGVVDAGGILALRWLHAGLAAGVVLAVGLLLRRAGLPAGIALGATVVYVWIAQGRFQVRPQMLHLALLVGLYGWLFVARPRLGVAQLGAVFAACVLWANAYSGAVLFPLLLWLHTAVEWLQRRAGWRRPVPDDLGGGELRRVAILAALATLAVLLTPHGPALVGYVIETRRVNAGLSSEWLPIPGPWSAEPGVRFWWAVAAATLVSAVACRRRISFSGAAVALAMTLLPLQSRRFTDLAFASLVFLAGCWGGWVRARPRVALAGGAAGLALAVGFVGASAVAWAPQRALERFSSARDFRDAMFPVEAMSFLDEVGLEGRLFASNKWGGYVLLRAHDRYPVFVDGRWVTIGRRVVRDAAAISLRRPSDAEAMRLLDAYGIELLLVHRGWMTEPIRAAQGWVPVFLNRNSAVYSRGRADDLERVARYYRAQGIPFDTERGFDERAAVEASPQWARLHRVQRVHLDQFGAHGARAPWRGRPVEGW